MFEQSQVRRPCPWCEHYPMHPLARFLVEDVNDAPYVDVYIPARPLMKWFPFWSLSFILISWIGKLLFGKARLERNRAKVRHARAEYLERSPKSLICPNCFEVLEIL